MPKIYLRKVKVSDETYFKKWWGDKELLALTSGILEPISDEEVSQYFQEIFDSKNDYHFIITINEKTIGHISLAQRDNDWYETQIVIGEKTYWGKGIGPQAIKILIEKAKIDGVHKIYLEVRPTNTRAIRAYENAGFQKVGTTILSQDKNLPEIIRMELGR